MRETAAKMKVATQMGNQGTSHPGFRYRHRADPVRGRRAGPRGPRLDEPAVQVLEAGAGPRGTARGDAAGAAARGLGPLARPRPRAAVPPGLPPARLARLVGLRHRRAGRHGLPHGQPAVHGAEAGPADPRLGRERRGEPRDLPRLGDDHLRVPGAGRPPAGEADLVRGGPRRQAPPPAGRALRGRDAVVQRLAAGRREGVDLLAERLRRGPVAPARREVRGEAAHHHGRGAQDDRAAPPTRITRPSGSAPSARATPRSPGPTSATRGR